MASSQDACAYSCDETPGELEPYGDIAGLGVILSFLITSFMVVAFLTIFYLVFHNPDLDPFRPMNDMTTETQYPNPVDRAFLYAFRRGTSMQVISSRFAGSRAGQLESTLNKCILMFADIQIFTGIAILVSGYTTLQCRLSEYHWQTIVHLAWFASVTHLAALTFLRHYLHNHPTEKTWRVVAMLIMLILLIVAMIPTSHFTWANDYDQHDEKYDLVNTANSYAVCSYRPGVDSDTFAFQSMLISVLILIYGYLIRLAKMRSGLANSLRGMASTLKEQSASRLENWNPDLSQSVLRIMLSITLEPISIAAFQVLHVQLDLLTSLFSEVFWLVFSAAWGTSRIFSTRGHSPGGENTWTFGQVLPLVLLIAPLLSMVVHIIDYFASRNPPESNSGVHEVNHELTEMHTVNTHGRTEGIEYTQNDSQPNGIHSDSHQGLSVDATRVQYENSGYFQGVVFLAAWSYFNFGISLVIFDLGKPSSLASSLALEAFVFQPVFQLLWALLCLWLSKLKLQKWISSSLHFLGFLAILKTQTYQFLMDRLKAKRLPILVIAYILFVILSIFNLSSQHTSVSVKPVKLLVAAIIQLMVSAISIGGIIGVLFLFFNWNWVDGIFQNIAFWSGFITCCQMVWFFIELWFENRSTPILRQKRIKVTVFFIWWLSLLPLKHSIPIFSEPLLTYLSSFFCISFFWSIHSLIVYLM